MFVSNFAKQVGNNLQVAQPEGERVDAGAEVNDLVGKLMPWMLSIVLHSGLILASVFLVWTMTGVADNDDVQQPIIPQVGISKDAGALLVMSERDSTLHDDSAMERPSAVSVAPSISRLLTRSVRDRGIGNIGLRPGSPGGPGSGESMTGEGWGNSALSDDGGGGIGKANPFGTGVGDAGRDFRTNFGGSRGNARNLVYLVDASGSLIDTMPFVVRELQRSIGQLSDQQKFTVIFFQGDEAIEAPPAGLKQATPDAKQGVIQWVDPATGNVTPMSRANPIKALQKALLYKPDLVFILSDNITGEGINEVDQRDLLAAIEAARHGAGTKINTIQFLYPDKLTRVGMKGTLELIADRSGGNYLFLDGKKLGIQ